MLEEVLSKLLDLGFTLFFIIMVEIFRHEVRQRLSISIECCNDAMMLHGSMVYSDRAVLSSFRDAGHGSALRLIPDHRRYTMRARPGLMPCCMIFPI